MTYLNHLQVLNCNNRQQIYPPSNQNATSRIVITKYVLYEYNIISRARKIVTKFHNYSYEIVMSPVIVNSYKNGHNSYQIVK